MIYLFAYFLASLSNKYARNPTQTTLNIAKHAAAPSHVKDEHVGGGGVAKWPLQSVAYVKMSLPIVIHIYVPFRVVAFRTHTYVLISAQ